MAWRRARRACSRSCASATPWSTTTAARSAAGTGRRRTTDVEEKRMKLVLAAVVAFLVAGCGFTNTKTQVETQTVTVTRTETHTVTSSTTQPSPAVSASACTATDLTGSFSVVPGSAGAGNIVYTLRVKNVGQDACSVSGIPQAQLIDASGKPLETSGTPNA